MYIYTTLLIVLIQVICSEGSMKSFISQRIFRFLVGSMEYLYSLSLHLPVTDVVVELLYKETLLHLQLHMENVVDRKETLKHQWNLS